MGAETDLTSGQVRWLSPLPLWTGVLAGPVVWAANLTVSYALVKWVCSSRQFGVLHLITVISVVVVIAAAWLSWAALHETRGEMPADGGEPPERARFMAILGLTSSAFFIVAILANEMPRWVLDACR